MTFGERVKKLRKESGLTQDVLAEKVGVTKSAVSAWENNQRRPSFDVLDAMCTLFKVDLAFLLGQTDTNSYKELSDDEVKVMGTWTVLEEYEDLFRKFAILDSHGQAAVSAILRAEFARCTETGTLQQARYISVSIKQKEVSIDELSELEDSDQVQVKVDANGVKVD